jgi:hypothetical protein
LKVTDKNDKLYTKGEAVNTMSKDLQTVDFEYFEENKTKFFEEYGHKFLAIKDRVILGAFDTFDDALKTTLKTESPGTFIVQECTGDEMNLMHVFQNNVLPANSLVM